MGEMLLRLPSYVLAEAEIVVADDLLVAKDIVCDLRGSEIGGAWRVQRRLCSAATCCGSAIMFHPCPF